MADRFAEESDDPFAELLHDPERSEVDEAHRDQAEDDMEETQRPQFLLETHSEHLMLRLLRRIRETTEPFHAIIATERAGNEPQILVEEDLDSANPLWTVRRTCSVARTPEGFASALGGILSMARRIVIVDYAYKPAEPRFNEVLQSLLRIVEKAGLTRDASLVVRCDDRRPPWEVFRRSCESYVPRRVPDGFRLHVVYAEQRQGGRRLHDRYLITDIGTVLLGDSLDEGDPAERNDFALLDEAHHRELLSDFSRLAEVFNVVGRVSIIGAAVPRATAAW